MFGPEGQAHIVEAARKLVRRRGHASVSLRRIAAAAGYSPAGLYAHFPGREAIMEAVADKVRGDLAAALERAVDGRAAPAEQLVAVGLAYIAFALDHAPEFELLFRFTRSRKRTSADPSPSSFDLLRRIVRRGAPSAGAEEIDLACLRLWSTAHGLADLRAFHLSEFDCDWNAWTRQILRRQVEEALCSAGRDG